MHEKAREHGFELLRGGIGGRQNDPAGAGDLAKECEAGARRIDEHHFGGDRLQHFGPVARAKVRADQIEFRIVDIHRRAVPDEHDRELIVFR